jgi:hypothetical protein
MALSEISRAPITTESLNTARITIQLDTILLDENQHQTETWDTFENIVTTIANEKNRALYLLMTNIPRGISRASNILKRIFNELKTLTFVSRLPSIKKTAKELSETDETTF